jgi:hypothetical protein
MPDTEPPRNLDTYAVHRQESLWQIWLPLAATLIGLTLLVILIWLSQHGALSQWAAVALIMLIIPAMILGIILLVLNIGGVVLFSMAYSKISPYMLQGQIFIRRVEQGAFQYADITAEPFIKIRVLWARISALRGRKTGPQ